MMQTEEEMPPLTTTNGGDLKRDHGQMTPVTKLPSSSDAVAVPPPLKKMKATPMLNFFSSLQKTVGSAPTFDQLSRGGAGTDCYGIVVSEWEGKSHDVKGKEGATFDVTTVRVILGAVDPAKDILVDEATNEIVFNLPDPDALKAALKLKEQNKSTERVTVEERLEYRVAMHQVQRISLLETLELREVPFPAVVHIEGFRCKASR